MAKTNVVLKSVWDDKGIKAAKKEFADFGKSIGVAFAAVGAATLAGAAALVRFGSDAIKAGEEVAIANNRLAQINKSMGLFGGQTAAVTKRLIDFANANELTVAVDAEVIKATQAKLLTFKELGKTADEAGGAFDRATIAALDLAAAGFGSAESNAVQLGKALQDPIKGLAALRRAGVTFTESEKEKIKALVQSGQILEAQNVILSAIETQVGGTAAATAKASDIMDIAFTNVSEAIGLALLPTFREFADEIVKITPTLEQALAPAAAEIGQVFKDEVLPAVRDFTKWLASPDGVETIREFAQAIIDSIKSLIDFIGWVVKNREALGILITTIGVLIVTFKTVAAVTALYKAALVLYNTQVVTATGTTTAFATALKALPWVALIAGATAFIGTMSSYADEVYGSKVNTDGLTEAQAAQFRKVEGLQKLLKQYEYALENGTEANKDLARDGIARVNSQLRAMGLTTQEVNAIMNGTSLAKYRSQLGDTRVDAERLVNAQKQLYYAMRGEKVPTTPTPTPTPTPTGSSGPSPFEQAQKIIKDTQKKLREAQKAYGDAIASATKAYNDTIAEATKTYEKAVADAEVNRDKALAGALKQHNQNIATIQADFAKRQTDIITQSINRLRDAYATSVRTNIASLFEDENVAKSVDNLVANLRDRLTASRQLVVNAAQLASGGFSQTFIEQIVGAGLETGNELANAILTATPETQNELKSLFNTLESESETGMDSLAQTMYEKTGLATTELKKLFTQTQTDLIATLAQAQADYAAAQAEIQTSFTEALANAAETRDEAFAKANERLQEQLEEAKTKFVETVEAIKEAFLEQIAEIEKGMGGLESTAKRLIALLDEIISKNATATNVPAPKATPFPAAASSSTAATKATGTTNYYINNTIKTDATKSAAQAGAEVSKALNKYTSKGGGLKIGPGAI